MNFLLNLEEFSGISLLIFFECEICERRMKDPLLIPQQPILPQTTKNRFIHSF